MKKLIALLLTFTMLGSLAACGGEKNTPETYHNMLENKEGVYYYEAEVEEEFPDEGTEPMKSLGGEARDGKGSIVLLSGEKELDTRQIETPDSFYYVYEPDKTYTKEALEAPSESAKMTLQDQGTMEFDGKTYDYAEYVEEYEMESYVDEDTQEAVAETFLYKQRYLLDKSGDLCAIIIVQEKKGVDGEENIPIYKKTERITKFTQGSYPEEVFEIPKDYKEITQEDEEYADSGDEK